MNPPFPPRRSSCLKRDELVARAKAAAAQAQVADAIKSIDVMDPSSDLGRFEEKIRREEARVLGQQEIAASTLDEQFEALEDTDRAVALEDRKSTSLHSSHSCASRMPSSD